MRSRLGPRAGVGRIFAVIAAALLALTVTAVPASADEDDWSIPRYEIDVQIDEQGEAELVFDFDFDFADSPGHGPMLVFPTRQRIDDDPNNYRVLDYAVTGAQSPSGAPDDLTVEREGNSLEVYIGDEDVEVEGLQSYRITLRASGLVNSGVGPDGEDEFFWQAVEGGTELPLSDIAVQVRATQDPLQVTCRIGSPDSGRECADAEVQGGSAQFAQDTLDEEEFVVAAQFPAGTFGGAEPELTPRATFSSTFGLTTPAGPVAAVLTVLGIGAVLMRVRRSGRDEQYQGLTPGLSPAAGQEVEVGPRDSGEVAVQFHPPQGVRPGEVGTLADEVADPHDVTATIVDLAVRGYFRIEESASEDDDGEAVEGGVGEDAGVLRDDELDGHVVADGGVVADDGDAVDGGAEDSEEEPVEHSQWAFVRDDDARGFDDPDLADYERDVLRSIFHGSSRKVSLGAIAGEFREARNQLQTDLYDEVTERGWFKSAPQVVRTAWVLTGLGILVAGIVAGIVLALTVGWAVIGAAFALVGMVTMVASASAPARTAEGTAVLVQSLGFKKYLETAEADQIRFEEGQDIFSRYLPFAIAFGVTDRWATVFEEIAESGRELPEPTWYSGPALGHGVWAVALGDAMSGFTHDADAAVMSTATGGSAFTGGIPGGGAVGGARVGGW